MPGWATLCRTLLILIILSPLLIIIVILRIIPGILIFIIGFSGVLIIIIVLDRLLVFSLFLQPFDEPVIYRLFTEPVVKQTSDSVAAAVRCIPSTIIIFVLIRGRGGIPLCVSIGVFVVPSSRGLGGLDFPVVLGHDSSHMVRSTATPGRRTIIAVLRYFFVLEIPQRTPTCRFRTVIELFTSQESRECASRVGPVRTGAIVIAFGTDIRSRRIDVSRMTFGSGTGTAHVCVTEASLLERPRNFVTFTRRFLLRGQKLFIFPRETSTTTLRKSSIDAVDTLTVLAIGIDFDIIKPRVVVGSIDVSAVALLCFARCAPLFAAFVGPAPATVSVRRGFAVADMLVVRVLAVARVGTVFGLGVED